MGLENRLDLKLSQRLILTPQLQLAIKLLQHTQLELSQAINQELMENPFLEERQDPYEEDAPSSEMEEVRTTADDDAAELDYERLITFTNDEYFEERGSDGRDLGYFGTDTEELPSYEAFYAKKPDLYEDLLWQLRLSDADEALRRVAGAVIANLDEDGYLRVPAEEIAQILGIEPSMVEDAIGLVQTFDPPGVAARDLRECLLIQLGHLGLKDSLAEKIVRDHLTDIQNKRHHAIAKKYGVSPEELMAAIAVIERLEPRPGRQFSGAEVTYVVPDVFIEKIDGDYRIVLNDEGIPRLTINNYYRKLLSNKDSLSKEERDFLRDKLRRAIELTRSLDQRNRTIYKVSESILKFQRDFFDFGSKYLKPLTLKDVAMDVGMHESTISRVTSNKFLACSQGVFSFRYFFSSSVSGQEGDVSSTIVKELIKEIIGSEDPMKPLSDQAIADKLQEVHKITIARRTVAKYREELRLPPQSGRKKIKI
jgi:RNA polymerase sigma-54 factor